MCRYTCTENLVKSGRVVFAICETASGQTNKQTDTQTLIAMLCTPSGGKVINKLVTVKQIYTTTCTNKQILQTVCHDLMKIQQYCHYVI